MSVLNTIGKKEKYKVKFCGNKKFLFSKQTIMVLVFIIRLLPREVEKDRRKEERERGREGRKGTNRILTAFDCINITRTHHTELPWKF